MQRTEWQDLQVLMVEPEECLAAPMAERLLALGACVSRVPDGRSALAHLRRHATDAVLLAAPLPDADRTGLADWIQQEPAAPVLILLGTDASAPSRSGAGAEGRGPDAVLERRAKPEEVCQAIAAAWSARMDEPAGETPTSLPELLVGLHDRGDSGVLEVRADGVCTRIFYRRGAPVFAEGGALRETLGRMLLQRGALTDAEYLRVIERMTERLMESETTRMGEVLVELGLLTPEQVFVALSEQVREKIIGCFHWERFSHSFEPADELAEDLSSYPSLRLEALLLTGLRTHYGPDRLEPILAPFADRRPALVEDVAQLTTSFQLAPAEQRLLRLCDRQRTLSAIRAIAPLDAVHAAQVLSALILANRFVWQDEGTARQQEAAAAKVRPPSRRPPEPVRSPATKAPPAGRVPEQPRTGIPHTLGRLRRSLVRAGKEGPRPIDPKGAALEAERAFRQGLLCLERSAIAGALRAFGRACALRGDEPEYRMCEAWAALLAASDEETRVVARAKAATCAQRMLQRDRGSARAHGILGQIRLAARDVDAAEAHFRAVLRVAPEDRDALRGIRMVERRRASH